ncbi:MAG TPA: hypothetical protein VHS03_11695 [Gaiellaceae bacterium]|nr:hypothetical protein [Gaiellaceae bacterium]
MIVDAWLYACRFKAYSIVVVAQNPAAARATFQRWLSDRHGVDVRVEALPYPRSVKSLGQRPLLMEVPS